MHSIYIINGPNLNLLGKREVEIYGSVSFEDYFQILQKKFNDQISLYYFQSNHEGRLIDKLQEVGFDDVGIILNAAGYTHTSVAMGDTVTAISAPVVEVHISDILTREKFRHHSYIQQHAVQFIKGRGLAGYDEAITYLLNNT